MSTRNPNRKANPENHRFEMRIKSSETPVLAAWIWNRPYVGVRQLRQALGVLAEVLGEEAFDKLVTEASTSKGAQSIGRAIVASWAYPGAVPGWPFAGHGMPLAGAPAAPPPPAAAQEMARAEDRPMPAPPEPATAGGDDGHRGDARKAGPASQGQGQGKAPGEEQPGEAAAAEPAKSSGPKPNRSLEILKKVGLEALSEQKTRSANALLANENMFKQPTNG